MDNKSGREQSAANSPMEQVREIIFGAQLKDMEIRFKRQEERLAQEIGGIRDSFKTRLESLENFMKSEVAGLLERLRRESEEREASRKAEQRERAEFWQKEQRERIEALKNEERERQEASTRLASDLAATSADLERKLAKLSQTLDSAERDLRTLLMDESADLNDKIEAKYSDALRALAKTDAQIRNDMVYRAALSGFFAETVGGLAKPWNAEALELPGEAPVSAPQGLTPAREEGPEEPREEEDREEEAPAGPPPAQASDGLTKPLNAEAPEPPQPPSEDLPPALAADSLTKAINAAAKALPEEPLKPPQPPSAKEEETPEDLPPARAESPAAAPPWFPVAPGEVTPVIPPQAPAESPAAAPSRPPSAPVEEASEETPEETPGKEAPEKKENPAPAARPDSADSD